MLSRAQVAAVLDALNDPAQRAKLVATLEALEQALPAGSPGKAEPPAPAAAPVAAVPIAANSLLPQLLRQLSRWSAGLAVQTMSLGHALSGLPAVWVWLRSVATDPEMPYAVGTGAAKIAICLVLAFLSRWLVARLTRPSLRRLRSYAEGRAGRQNGAAHANHRVWQQVRTLPLVVLRLVLDLLPIGVFAAIGFLLPSWILGPDDPVRPAILALVNAFVMFGIVMAVVRALVSPDAHALRPVPISDAAAAIIVRWVRWLAAIPIFGLMAASLGALWGMGDNTVLALEKLVVLIDHALLVLAVLQRRREVSTFLMPRPGATGAFVSARYALASAWHYLAIFFIVGAWLVWAADLRNGYVRLLQVVVVTAVVLLGARVLAALLLSGLDRVARRTPQFAAGHPAILARAERYHHLLRSVIPVAVGVAAGILLLQLIGLDAMAWFTRNPVGQQLVAATISIGITIVLAIAVWEAVNVSIEQYLDRLAREAQFARAARLRTILPILRTALMVTVLIVAALTTLGQIGVNIGPLLAGAGIIGVAIGFGSQKLVQDFITGIFLLLESAMQVGDAVTVAGVSGVVEHLSIRTIRLRAGDGSVYLIPFSSVTTVNNANRGLGNAAVNVSVAAHEDTDRVAEVLTNIAAEMRAEPAFKGAMLSDLQLWGVDQVSGAGVTLAGQIVCTDAGRWSVQREFNRRYRMKLAELGIELAMPTQTVVMRPAAPGEPPEAKVAGAKAAGADRPAS